MTLGADFLCEAKVTELGEALGVDHDVFWLEVTVHVAQLCKGGLGGEGTIP